MLESICVAIDFDTRAEGRNRVSMRSLLLLFHHSFIDEQIDMESLCNTVDVVSSTCTCMSPVSYFFTWHCT